MSSELWDRIVDKLELSLGKVDIEKLEETQEDDLGHQIVSKIERIETEIGGQRIRIEKVVRPVILDKKTHYSHSSSNKTSVEYILSDDEFSTKVRAFKYNEDLDAWDEINLSQGLF